ncbi:helix-turn-helix domain-containing protein [Paraburkholderia phytofirmans]|uniref:helix-turn-helix domain-containing protein n=1 Tax=Paraburkholderia phytofirmans TaxID=261302 RepID=UPI001F1928FA|nr:helix-turn-helix transcriptional regulator [Paraburkholderia phytofirmans]
MRKIFVIKKQGTCTLVPTASYRNDAGVPNLSSHRQNPTLVALGAAIRRVRRERGLSQEQLALSAEVDVSYLGRVERGDNAAALLTLKRIADALQISMASLMDEAKL